MGSYWDCRENEVKDSCWISVMVSWTQLKDLFLCCASRWLYDIVCFPFEWPDRFHCLLRAFPSFQLKVGGLAMTTAKSSRSQRRTRGTFIIQDALCKFLWAVACFSAIQSWRPQIQQILSSCCKCNGYNKINSSSSVKIHPDVLGFYRILS